MQEFAFDQQAAIEVYKKHFLTSTKPIITPYSKEQLDGVFIAIKSQIALLIQTLVGEKHFSYKTTIPFFYINEIEQKVNEYEVEILVVGSIIECVSIPGCIVEGLDREIAFDNLIKAVIQCSDARIKNGLWFLNRVFPVDMWVDGQATSSSSLLKKLENDGWNIKYESPYHTVLLRTGSKVTYTIANDTEISGALSFAYNRLQLLTNGKEFGKIQRERNDNK